LIGRSGAAGGWGYEFGSGGPGFRKAAKLAGKGVWKTVAFRPAIKELETMPDPAYFTEGFENMLKSASEEQPKPVRWVGSSKEDLSDFPEEVRRRVGGALWEAQIGRKAAYAKPLKGFGDAGVLEIVEGFAGDTFRAVYTVRFAKAVYVLHAFQKKSKRGIATPKSELDLIDQRLKRAKEDYEQWSKSEKPISP
jgi:phage-related protein